MPVSATRRAWRILYALWEARTADGLADDPLSFADLRRRVGMRDGSQFNYHLQKLVGRFVFHDDAGYVLTRRGERIMGTVLAGTMTESVTFDAEPISDPCPLCGGAVVLHYGNEASPDKFTVCCTACEGAWANPGLPPGLLMIVDPLLPVGILDRTPAEMYEAQYTATQLHIASLVEGN
ncbi:hypothetical protein [Haladaptatus sp. DYSN1]|uniref:DUF7347 domain-containing protein n=1 Tax=unclassified Haladaptatus TaxID=2622732 RepID=UPI002404F8DD|nr:hypothetical protein [Haladaptatus sp. DYSN1]